MSRKREGSLQTSASRKPRYDEIIMIDSSDDEQVVPRVGDDECVILEDKYIPPNPDLQVATLVLDSQEVPGSSKGKAPKKTPGMLKKTARININFFLKMYWRVHSAASNSSWELFKSTQHNATAGLQKKLRSLRTWIKRSPRQASIKICQSRLKR